MVTQADVVEAHGSLKRNGKEWHGPCPLCGGRDRFYVVPDGKFYCRQCLPDGSNTPRYVEMKKALGLDREAMPNGDPTEDTYSYHSAPGRHHATVVRTNFLDGRKTFRVEWARGVSKDDIIPLYRLPDLLKRKEAPVLVVEGEKTANRAALLFPDHVVVTSMSGSAQAHRSDWSPTWKRHVVIWPDNDDQGRKYAKHVAQLCRDAGADTIERVHPPPRTPPGWDLGDPVPAGLDIHATLAKAVSVDGLGFKPLEWWYTRPQPEERWLVERLIGHDHLVMMAAAPKAGKSTIGRNLAVAVSSGARWLGHRVSRPGPAFYLALEGSESDILDHFRSLKAHEKDLPMQMLPPIPIKERADVIDRLAADIRKREPVLVIVDTLGKMLGTEETNDYGAVVGAMAQFERVAKETQCAIVLIHHSSKHGGGILGSQAFAAASDVNIIIKHDQEKNERTVSALGRANVEVNNLVIHYDRDTGAISTPGTVFEVERVDIEAEILRILPPHHRPGITVSAIKEKVSRRGDAVAQALDVMVRRQQIDRFAGERNAKLHRLPPEPHPEF